MAADEYEGDDLVTMKSKTLVRMLRETAGAVSISALLSARDEYVAAGRAAEVWAVTPPHEFTCPISQELMRDSVVTSNGQCYERAEIAKWLKNHQTDPISNADPRIEEEQAVGTECATEAVDHTVAGGAYT